MSATTTRPTPRPRLLDLCCKAGGASAGYHAAGFDIVGVDLEPQPDYPFTFVQADALQVDLSGFEVIAASPPCQLWSQATPPDRRGMHPDLIGPIRERLEAAITAPGGPWAYVIENVPGAPLRDPIVVCGDSLRLGVRRHRLFESNLPLAGTPCWHDRAAPPVAVYGTYGQRVRRNDRGANVPLAGRNALEGETSPGGTERARAAMGIDWMPWPALTQAIPPAYTHWLGVQLLTHRPVGVGADVGRDTSTELGDCVTTTTGRDETHQGRSVVAAVTQDAGGKRHLPTRDTTPPAGIRHRHCRCGRPLPARPVTGRWPRYCSHACRQSAYRERHRTATTGTAEDRSA
jgi:hypothetical protein